MSEGRPVTIHLHVPKAAGSSVGKVFLSHFDDPARCLNHVAVNRLGRDAPIPPEIDYVYGHVRYGIHARMARPAVYVTAMRDPLSRLCSLFNWVHLRPRHWNHRFFKDHVPTMAHLVALIDAPQHAERLAAYKNQVSKIFGVRRADALGACLDDIEARMAAGGFVSGTIGDVEAWLRAAGFLAPGAPMPRAKHTAALLASEPAPDFEKAAPQTLPADVRAALMEKNALDCAFVDGVLAAARRTQPAAPRLIEA
ncbi:MAG: hypothetical protein AAF318_13840 [Pseudomonadota bacterium]